MLSYIKNKKDFDTYFNNGNSRTSIDFLFQNKNITENNINYILDTVPFINKDTFSLPDFSNYNIIIYSPLTDYIQGKYINNKINNFIGSWWGGGKIGPIKSNISEKDLKIISSESKYSLPILKKYINSGWKNIIKDDNIYKKQLNKLFFNMKHCKKVIVILGATETYSNMDKDKQEIHIKYNNFIKNISSKYNNISLIYPDKFIKKKEDFIPLAGTPSIRHYHRNIYMKMGSEISKLL